MSLTWGTTTATADNILVFYTDQELDQRETIYSDGPGLPSPLEAQWCCPSTNNRTQQGGSKGRRGQDPWAESVIGLWAVYPTSSSRALDTTVLATTQLPFPVETHTQACMCAHTHTHIYKTHTHITCTPSLSLSVCFFCLAFGFLGFLEPVKLNNGHSLTADFYPSTIKH